MYFYFYLFIYLFKSDSRSITEKKTQTKKTKQNKTAKTAQNNSNSKIYKAYFKQYCPYKIIDETNVHVRKTTSMKNNKACAYNKQKIDYQKSNKVHHVGDKKVRGVKAAINKIIQIFSQKSFKNTYIIYNL